MMTVLEYEKLPFLFLILNCFSSSASVLFIDEYKE